MAAFGVRLAWALLVAVLVVGPILFTRARAERFEASVEVLAVAPESELEPDPVVYLASLAERGAVRDDALARVELRGREDLLATASFTPAGRKRYLLTVEADTPDRAAALAGSLAESLSGFSGATGDPGEPRLAVGRRPAPPQPARWADELVDALPGAFPPRPSALWAGIAGGLVAFGVWLTSRLRRSPSGAPPIRARG